MAESTGNIELMTEHFGFLPLSFIDDVINAVNELIYQVAQSLEIFLEQTTGGGEETEQGIHQVETLLEHAVDKNFDIFELYTLKNIFTVPSDVTIILPHQEGCNFNIDPSCEEKLDKELEVMRKKLLTAKAFNHKLKKEMKITDIRLARYEKFHEQLSFLMVLAENYKISPIPDTMKLVSDQLNAVKNLIKLLRNQITGIMMERVLKKRKENSEVGEIEVEGEEKIPKKRAKSNHPSDNNSETCLEVKVEDDIEIKRSISDELMGTNKLESLEELQKILEI
ncbi:hypothetical protein G9A89_002887 [Geosiphon pyriformis]|nr:hypothetical protein G9A89_002887 [Geosiphon pyriformis]